MAKNLVIVESPAKAKTLKKFLGSSYTIEASVGHVRDLPKSEMGIDIENDFEPKYITIRGKGEILTKLRKKVKTADKVYLATDPDREGEAISWHLMHALKLDSQKARRITFNEITKAAVKKSIKDARDIDMNLVDAQQARRSLDRIVGYKISPLLWRKIKRGLSAGRVQSVALRIICDREEEIASFVPEEYWTLEAQVSTGKQRFIAHYTSSDNKKFELKTQADALSVIAKTDGCQWAVKELKTGVRQKKPGPPFTTSTLQQEASKVLGFTAQKTMQIAQQLYEGVEIKGEGNMGLITYIRTDSVRIADEAYEDAKAFILSNYGEEFASPERPQYKTKGRAQDAHEAVRPSYADKTPDAIKDSLSRDQYRLYKLIWERFVASQMSPAVYDSLTVKISAGEVIYRASGSVLKFKGYLAVYAKNEESEVDVRMPALVEGQALMLIEHLPEQHFTQPPPRYSEATLVKTLEELGIGRPSTYAATISTLTNRFYVTKENKVFYTTEMGTIVNEVMVDNFDDIVDIEFTAKMEERLDEVEEGTLEWKEVLRTFYAPFNDKIMEAEEKIGHIDIQDEVTDIICENCGKNMVIKFGRFGKFLACPGFPECKNTKPLLEDAGVACPLCGRRILIKKTKKKRKYYGCEGNPDECGFMSWTLPTGELCPECGSPLVEKGGKTKYIGCSNADCMFKKDAPAEDADVLDAPDTPAEMDSMDAPDMDDTDAIDDMESVEETTAAAE
ncbi:MAG: type I DNA topoisomerase [Clostridiales bacterium]|jgi:DNA topoisomerase-1|nr:type I DNA topoisomerase [Clostridiales bacterium]